MKRRTLITSLIAAIATPAAAMAKARQCVSDRFPVIAIRHRDGATEHYTGAGSNELDWPDHEAQPAEFIATGRFTVFHVRVESLPADPAAIPSEFTAGIVHGAEPLTRADAVAQAIEFNRQAIRSAGDRWAVVIEAGEPQGPSSMAVELRPDESIATLTRSATAPGRVVSLRGEA